MQDGHVEGADRISGGIAVALGFQAIPLPTQEHPESLDLRGLGIAGGGNLELFRNLGHEFFRGMTVQVLHDPVVIHDVELVRREDDGLEKIVAFLTGVSGILGLAVVVDSGSGGAAVVAVGDVEGIDLLEGLFDFPDEGVVVDDPDGVYETVGAGEIVKRLFGPNPVEETIEHLVVAVGEEDRAGVGIGGGDVVGAIVFLVPAGELVLLDQVLLVFLDRGPGHEAGLDVSSHLLLIDIEAGLRFLDEDAPFDQFLEALGGLFVDFAVIVVELGREIDFGLGDVQERVGVFPDHLFRFFGGENVVGGSGHLGDEFEAGAEGAERFDDGHDR